VSQKKVLHIYTRVSTVAQEEEGTSLETQLESGIARANRLGMDYKVWNEGGRSSSHEDFSNRPVLTDLLNEIDNGNVTDLFVWNNDRLSRNLNTWGMIRYKLIKSDVTLHTPTGTQNLNDPQSNMLFGIMSEISLYDNVLRAERLKNGKMKRIRQGFWIGGPPPYGYQLQDKRLEVDKKEQKWVKFIYEQYASGKSIDDIRTLLLKNGVVTRRGKAVWSHGSINCLLTNTHFGGYYHYTDQRSGETIRMTCPKLLSSSLIQAVQTAREKRSYTSSNSRRTKTSNQKHTYLLTGFLVCGHCGAFYGGNLKTKQTSYYSCNQKTNRYKTKFTFKEVICGSNRNVRIDSTDEFVWNVVVDVLSSSNLFKQSVKEEMLGGGSFQQNSKEMRNLQKRQQRLKKDLDSINQSIVNFEVEALIAKVSKENLKNIIKNLDERRLEIDAELEQIQSSLDAQLQQRKWVDWVKEFGTRIGRMKNGEMSVEEKRKFLEGILNKITITNCGVRDHELVFEFKLPYVGDRIEYRDSSNKSKGYEIVKGRKTRKEVIALLKKQ